jgi:hypothetical protein
MEDTIEPRVEAETGQGINREGGAEMKTKTKGGIEKGRAERTTGTFDGNFATRNSVSICWKLSGVETFYRWPLALTMTRFY